MMWRTAQAGAIGAAGAFALAFLVLAGFGSVNGYAQRIPFSIATGPSSATYFPVGEAIAGIISHPPGVDRCARVSACGPEGLIATAQTSAGSYANVLAVESGRIQSALAQSDIVAQAVAGKGAFRTKQTHIRIIAALFPEDVHVVVSTKTKIGTLTDLRGKRVSIGAPNSGTAVTARAILSAYRLRVRASSDSADLAAQKLQAGQLDAFFFVGGTPVPLIQALIASGHATLISIEGPQRKVLIARTPGLAADTIPSGAYGTSASVSTIGGEAVWIVNDSEPADTVFALTRALFSPANRATLNQTSPSARLISIDRAAKDLPAPLHMGAARFYKEAQKFSKNATIKPL